LRTGLPGYLEKGLMMNDLFTNPMIVFSYFASVSEELSGSPFEF